MHRLDMAVAWLFRLIPAAALLSVLFATEGPLRWIGLLGLVPLMLATRRECPSCALRPGSHRTLGGYVPWAGH